MISAVFLQKYTKACPHPAAFHRIVTPSSLAPASLKQGASHEENRPHLRHHLRRHDLRPYGRIASLYQQDRARPQHDSRLHHNGGVVPAGLLRCPQLPRQHPRRSNLLRPRLRLRHPHHPHYHRLLRRHVGDPLLQLHASLHGQLLRRADSPGPILRTRPRHHCHQGRCHSTLSAALPEPLRQHGLHLHRTAARRRHHYSHLRCDPPPQSPRRTHSRTRSHDHVSQRGTSGAETSVEAAAESDGCNGSRWLGQ